MAKAKKTVEDKNVWTIGVEADSHTQGNDDGDTSGEQYSYRGTTNTSWDVRGLRLVDDEDKARYLRFQDRVDVGFKPEKGKVYHLLYAVYSTGDSFGHDNGKNFTVIDVYKSRKVAEENEKRLREGKPEKKGLVQLKMEGRKDLHGYYCPWNGYFESLDRLEILSLILN